MRNRHQQLNRTRRTKPRLSPILHRQLPVLNRIDATFQRLKAKDEKALIAYLMGGDPGLLETERLVLAIEQAGADIIELGVPFSDPIADGPVIQQAAQRALRNGTSLRRILVLVRALRRRTQIPMVLMLYYNSIYAIGLEAFCKAASHAGIDGVIVPDMPPDEAEQLKVQAEATGLRVIFLLAPTSTDDRRRFVAQQSHGFVYYVSLTGITGAKLRDVKDVGRNVAMIRKISAVPVAVGFGVASPKEAAEVAKIADGVIVGSAIVKRIASHKQGSGMVRQVARFVRSLKAAMVEAAR